MDRRTQGAAQVIGLTMAALCLAACASSVPKNAPAWYANAVHNQQRGYPDLNSVPRAAAANNDQAHWAQIQAEADAAAAAMRANPRSQPAAPENPDAFVDDARAALDATRASHE